jgi:putative ABC transport system permease protein
VSWLFRMANVFRSSAVDRALDDEMQFHIEARVEDLVAAGMTRQAAELAASRQFGNRLRIRESSRDVKLLPWVESVFKDIRFAVRMFRKHIVVTGAAIASLTLALGACLAAFSLIDALILRPLPVREPERLIYLTFPTYSAGTPIGSNFSYPLFSRLRDAARHEVELFATSSDEDRRRVTFRNAETEDEVRVQFVTGNTFSVLGVRPAVGRLLTPADDLTPGAHAVAVVSHAFWRRRFGGDPSVVGSAFTFGEKRLQIVGVAQESFTGIEPGRLVDLWVPVAMYDAGGFTFTNREWNWLGVLGRLNPGVTRERARDVLQAPFSQFRRELTAGRRGPENPPELIERYVNTPLTLASAANGPSGLRERFDRPLSILSVLIGLVLLIAVSNVANLYLARAAVREREMSVRLSIGASRSRLVQQMLIESVLLVAAASVLGLLFARVAGPALIGMLAPSTNPVYLELRLDWRLVAFLGIAGGITTILFGLAPALRASRVAPIGALRGEEPRATSRTGLPRPLVAVQVSFSLAILFVAGLLLLSFGRLATTDLGFAKDGVLLVKVESRDRLDPEIARIAGRQLLERVRSAPGVSKASLSAWPLFSQGGWISLVRVAGHESDTFSPPHLPVSPGFFDTMGIRLVEGRDFIPSDSDPLVPTVVIVNEAFARHYFGAAASAIGRVYDRTGQPPPVRQEIVGVVTDARLSDLRSLPPPTVYVPLRGLGTMQVRAAGDPLTLTAIIDREVRATHPSLRATEFGLQSTRVANTLLRERLLALLSGFFAAVGLLMAAVGLYGVLSYSVVRRTREIGIRIALGARSGALVIAILRDAALMTGIGIVVGLAGGLYLSRFVKGFLHEVYPTDAFSIVMPIGCLLLTAFFAAVPAARRASQLNPVEALRSE